MNGYRMNGYRRHHGSWSAKTIRCRRNGNNIRGHHLRHGCGAIATSYVHHYFVNAIYYHHHS
jgi:hypothetical protein